MQPNATEIKTVFSVSPKILIARQITPATRSAIVKTVRSMLIEFLFIISSPFGC